MRIAFGLLVVFGTSVGLSPALQHDPEPESLQSTLSTRRMHHLRVYQPYAHHIRRGIIAGDNNVLQQGSNLLSSLVGGEFTTINKNSRASPTSSTHATRSTRERGGGGALPSSHEFTTLDNNSRAPSPSSTSSASSPTTSASSPSTSTSSPTTSTSSPTPTSSRTSSSPSSSTRESDSSMVGAGAGGGASSTPTTMRRSSRTSSDTSMETSDRTSSGDDESSSSTPTSTRNPVSEDRSPSSATSAPSSASHASNDSSDADDSDSESDEGSKSSSPSMNNASNARKSDDGTDHTGVIAGVCTAGGVVILAILGFVLYKFLNKRAGSADKPEQAIQWPDVTYDAGPATPTGLAAAQHDAPADTSVDMSGYEDNPFVDRVDSAAAPMSAQSNALPESYVDVPPATFGYASDAPTQPVAESTALATTYPKALVPSQSPTSNAPVSVPLSSADPPPNVPHRGDGAQFQHFVVGQTYPEEAIQLPYDAPVTRELYREQPDASPFDESRAVKN